MVLMSTTLSSLSPYNYQIESFTKTIELESGFHCIEVRQERGLGYSDLLLRNYRVESFHCAIGPSLRIGQWFGILPVSGVLQKDASFLQFKWKSWLIFQSILMTLGGGILNVLSFVYLCDVGFNIDNAGMLVFYGAAFIVQILFFNLSRHWPQLISQFTKIENISSITPRPHGAKDNKFTLRTTFNVWSFLILSLAFVEHGFCILSGVSNAYNSKDNSNVSVFEQHFATAFPQVFHMTPFAPWKAIILQIINLAATFAWNFMDLFIMLVSMGLAHRFDYLSASLNKTMGKEFSNHFWCCARNEYAHMCNLVRQVDKHIGPIIFLSFTQNLYIICKQLFNILKTKSPDPDPDPSWLGKSGPFGGLMPQIYFGFSFAFLLARFFAVAMLAAEVHHASKKPLGPLYYVSHKCYSIEVTRFLDQATSDLVALGGLDVFYVTRNLILTIASTVVTYELVMIQFFLPKVQPSCPEVNITKHT